jgi:NADPH:quinone reductase-like Zn-dependent oxidoreductase
VKADGQMKAIRLHGRGGPGQLVYEDAPTPAAGPGKVQVRVYAAGITPTELSWDATYENPDGSARIPSIPGHEFAGVVTATGAGVKDIEPGDTVYGTVDFFRDGSAAEYATVESDAMAPKPRTLDYAHAAGVPFSALTAWQALFEYGAVTPGQRVLIHGAAGAVGTYAVQLAHWSGAEVIATAAGRNAELLRDLGADQVIDYTTELFEDRIRDVDVVLDAVGGQTRERSWGVLSQDGILVTLAGPIPSDEAARQDKRGVFFTVKHNRAQLIQIGRLIDEGRLRPVVAAVLPLEHAREAFERGLGGHNRGKIVLEVAERWAAAG